MDKCRLRIISTDLAMLRGPTDLTSGQTYRLGRSGQCSFVVNDLSVSRVHAELVVNGTSLMVKDLGSMNGTFVDGVPVVGEAEVRPGQTVIFGNARFQLAATHDLAKLSIEEIADLSTHAPPYRNEMALLSDAEKRVLPWLLKGMVEKEIANQLNISFHTVHNHVRKIYKTFRVKSRGELLSKFVSKWKFPDKPAS